MRHPRGDGSPFELPGGRGRVLLLHGFTGTPWEVRPLGEALAARGFAVAAPLLAGHGRDAAHLAASGWHDWFASAVEAVDRMPGRPLAVAGLSMGGLLALHLAATRPQAARAVVAMATPLWLHAGADRLLAWLARSAAGRSLIAAAVAVRVRTGSDAVDPAVRHGNPCIPTMPPSSLLSLVDLMKTVRAELGRVRAPLLVVHARRDHTAPFACAGIIARGVGGPVRRLDLRRSFHLVTADVEREVVAAAVCDFLEPLLEEGP